jgi:hypothetical protein
LLTPAELARASGGSATDDLWKWAKRIVEPVGDTPRTE